MDAAISAPNTRSFTFVTSRHDPDRSLLSRPTDIDVTLHVPTSDVGIADPPPHPPAATRTNATAHDFIREGYRVPDTPASTGRGRSRRGGTLGP
jgi:hypothetical protein